VYFLYIKLEFKKPPLYDIIISAAQHAIIPHRLTEVPDGGLFSYAYGKEDQRMRNDTDIKKYLLIEYAQNPMNAISILSEYVKLYKIHFNKKSMEDAADCLNVSRGTLIKISKKKSNLRMNTLTTVIDALVESRCPEPDISAYLDYISIEYCRQCPLVNRIFNLSDFTSAFINGSVK